MNDVLISILEVIKETCEKQHDCKDCLFDLKDGCALCGEPMHWEMKELKEKNDEKR